MLRGSRLEYNDMTKLGFSYVLMIGMQTPEVLQKPMYTCRFDHQIYNSLQFPTLPPSPCCHTHKNEKKWKKLKYISEGATFAWWLYIHIIYISSVCSTSVTVHVQVPPPWSVLVTESIPIDWYAHSAYKIIPWCCSFCFVSKLMSTPCTILQTHGDNGMMTAYFT